MKHGIKNRWLARAALAFLLISTLPLPAFCQEASVREVSVKGSNGAWKVGFFIENCFTEKMDEAIQTGIKTVFTFYIQLYQKRKLWKDRKIASIQFHHSIQYDPIRGEYLVLLEESRSSRTTSRLEEAKRWMASVEEMEIRPSSPLKPGVPAELRIKAELDPVKLPFHLEYLFFFVSLWDFETKWYTKPLPL
ncbi:MAG: DUF4390 domain-containing protein [Thermodesulfobacteriota bacterium]